MVDQLPCADTDLGCEAQSDVDVRGNARVVPMWIVVAPDDVDESPGKPHPAHGATALPADLFRNLLTISSF